MSKKRDGEEVHWTTAPGLERAAWRAVSPDFYPGMGSSTAELWCYYRPQDKSRSARPMATQLERERTRVTTVIVMSEGCVGRVLVENGEQ